MAPNSHASNAATNASGGTAAPSRSRAQGSRRKVNHAADDAAYHGVISASTLAGSKRSAAEKGDGEPRVKRKRLEPAGTPSSSMGGAAGNGMGRKASNIAQDGEVEYRPSLVSLTRVFEYTSANPYGINL